METTHDSEMECGLALPRMALDSRTACRRHGIVNAAWPARSAASTLLVVTVTASRSLHRGVAQATHWNEKSPWVLRRSCLAMRETRTSQHGSPGSGMNFGLCLTARDAWFRTPACGASGRRSRRLRRTTIIRNGVLTQSARSAPRRPGFFRARVQVQQARKVYPERSDWLSGGHGHGVAWPCFCCREDTATQSRDRDTQDTNHIILLSNRSFTQASAFTRFNWLTTASLETKAGWVKRW